LEGNIIIALNKGFSTQSLNSTRAMGA